MYTCDSRQSVNDSFQCRRCTTTYLPDYASASIIRFAHYRSFASAAAIIIITDVEPRVSSRHTRVPDVGVDNIFTRAMRVVTVITR